MGAFVRIIGARYLFFALSLYSAISNAASEDMNRLIIASSELMVRTVAGRGYDRGSSFSEPLVYGQATLQPSNHGRTMCVAAVAEAIIRAMQAHSKETGNNKMYSDLPVIHWTRGALGNLRAHLYQYEGANSRGPGDAFERFGIGEKVPFEKLVPGDLLAFSRRKSGHAVVFLGYLDRQGKSIDIYDASRVAGFRYMSSQGQGLPISGIGYRNAYFHGVQGPFRCDRTVEDCGVLRRPSDYLNGGRLWVPERWKTAEAALRLRDMYLSNVTGKAPTLKRDAAEIVVEQMLLQELPEKYSVDFE
jgi:hypothetical protein